MPTSPKYGSSSIEWARTAPKTYTLTNTEQYSGQYGAPKLDPDTEAQKLIQQRMMIAEMAGISSPEAERLGGQAPSFKDAPPHVKRAWRRQIRDFFSEASDPRSDPNQGIQSMIDSGAVRYDEDGLWVASPNLGHKKTEAIVRAADAWADRVGLWRPREGGGADFDPSNYKPYGSEQNRMQWEEMKYGGPNP